jgi:hypothetical protein
MAALAIKAKSWRFCMSSKPESYFDKRIVARNIKHNKISKKEYEQFLKGLKDASVKSVPMFSDEAEKKDTK